MEDLIAFLGARLDEDVLVAIAAPRGPFVRHDPARVLAEVAAKRQIIEHNAHLHQMADPATHPGQEYVLAAGASDRVLRILALPYADHSDYRKEWRP